MVVILIVGRRRGAAVLARSEPADIVDDVSLDGHVRVEERHTFRSAWQIVAIAAYVMDVVADDFEILPAQKVAEPLLFEAVELKSLDVDVVGAAREFPRFHCSVAARELRAPLVFGLKGDPCGSRAGSLKSDRAAVYDVPHDCNVFR